TISFMLDANYPYLSIAAMVVESNDAFLAFDPSGIRVIDEDGMPRTAEEIQRDIVRELAVWDAGTEANQVPGVGPDQAIRQAAANTGAADETSGVRLYADATNDLAGPLANGFSSIDVVAVDGSPMEFDITVSNTSGGTFPGILTPVAWATHSDAVGFFSTGEVASEGLERLAEDGDPSALAGVLGTLDAILESGVANTPDGADAAGPIFSGGSYTFRVRASPEMPYFSLATMIVPSNDTFLAFGPAGIRLVAEDGTPRNATEIQAEAREELIAWDAGTEQNQSGAAGPDQAPQQSGPNTGADEGNGYVRLLDDPVWAYPVVADVVRVTVEPIGDDVPFVRGDGNSDGSVDMSDAMTSLGYLFLGAEPPSCLAALDANSTGKVNVSDAVYLLNFLFRGGPEIEAPYPDCGTEMGANCVSFSACP
ncbi:MAG: spondin domain-containing protein, partial [Planctomycetota bacterium]